jgi:predicted negative regulator of RcsB-dependent stress response
VRYQRGVVRARAGDTNGAIEDLQRALELRPNFPTAALELAIALVDADRAGDAEAPLVQAQQVPALDAQASFYLALAELRLGRYELARTNFERARERDPSLTTATQYYEGVIAFRRRDYDAAEQQFTTVQRQNPETPMGRESAQYLTVIADSRANDYSAFGTMALEYDSNVTLGPTQTVPGSVTGQGDWRYVLNLGGRWTPVRWGRFSASVAYEFFQSVQFELSDFNLTDNRPTVQLQYDFDWISIGLLGRYDYYLLGGESYLSEATGMPWVTIREEGFGRTEMYVRVQPRSFKAANCPPPSTTGPNSSCYGALNGIYSFVGTRQFFDLGNASRQLWVGYQLGNTSPQPGNTPQQEFNRDQYQYGSWAVEAGVRVPLPFDVLGELAYRYEHQNYNIASGCFSFPEANGNFPPQCIPNTQNMYPKGFTTTGLTRRNDDDHRVIFVLERPLPEVWDHLSVVASYFGTFNDSNKPIFTYDRNIGSLALEVRY